MKSFTSSKLKNDLYLVRHGKINYNDRFEDGGYVEVHGQLSTEGEKLVTATANKLTDTLDSEKITVITSPKRRCFQSADIIIDALIKSRKVEISVNNGFRDVKIVTKSDVRPTGSYGEWERNLKENETWYEGWLNCEKFYPGEEDPKTLHSRVGNAFSELQLDTPTIIICHEEVMLALADILGIKADRPTYAEAWLVTPDRHLG